MNSSSYPHLYSTASAAAAANTIGGEFAQQQHHVSYDHYSSNNIPSAGGGSGANSNSVVSANGSVASTTNNNKKKRKKRPRGHPSRPLSAYNLFFKDERQRILDSLPTNNPSNKKEGPEDVKDPRDEITWPGKRRRPHGKIGFENLAKEIGSRWKLIDEETKEYYKKLALEDLQRYSREMQEYEGRLIGGVGNGMMMKHFKTSTSSSSSDDDDN